jgi:hypothetical protein
MDDSAGERRRGERRTVDTRAPRERRAGPGRRIWIRRDSEEEVDEEKREVERREGTSRRSGDLRRKDQRRKGDRRLD